MSKKIIALVLFVAMMLMMVPAANAAKGDASYALGFEGANDVAQWFGDAFGSTLKPVANKANTYTIADGNITVELPEGFVTNKNAAFAEPAANAALNWGSSGSNVTIKLSGKYSDLVEYYYTQLGYMVPKAKAVKIPFRVYKDVEGETVTTPAPATAHSVGDMTPYVLVNGTPAPQDYMLNNGKGYTLLYYLTVPITEDNSTQTFELSVDGSTRFKVTVDWTNTSSTSSTSKAKINAVGKIQKQTANYNVVVDNTNKVIYYDIAKRNKTDAATIDKDALTSGSAPAISTYFAEMSAIRLAAIINAASETADPTTDFFYQMVNGRMTQVSKWDSIYSVTTEADKSIAYATGEKYASFPFSSYYEAIDKSDTIKADGTAGISGNDDDYDRYNLAYNAYLSGQDTSYVGNANNVMTARFQALYDDGTIMPVNTVVTVDSFNDKGLYGSSVEAELLKYTERYAMVGGTATHFLDSNGCFVISMKGIQSWDCISGDVVKKYSEKMHTLTLGFKTGSAAKIGVTYDIVFRNVERNKSGITVLDSEIILEVGDTYTIQFVVDNADALEKSVEWKSVNKAIVKVDTASTGKITAVALGDTLVYAEDKAGNSHVVRVFVVEDKNGATDPEPVDPGDEPSSDGDLYAVTASSLNVRKGPGTSYAKVGSLKRGAEVVVIEVIKDGVWMQIEAVSGFKAADAYYVSGKYLSLVD